MKHHERGHSRRSARRRLVAALTLCLLPVAALAAEATSITLVGATVHTGAGGAPIEDAVIVIRAGRIESIGRREDVRAPEGEVTVVDLDGKFIVPGLIDTHVHYSQTGWADGRPDALDLGEKGYPYDRAMADCRLHPDRFHRAFLACGVTAVLDCGGFPWTRGLRGATEDSTDAPHVSAAGPLLATWVPSFGLPDQTQFVLIEDTDDVAASVSSHAAQESDAIKVWFIARGRQDVERLSPLVMAAGKEARARGLPLIVHATTLESARVAIRAGAHLLVHSVEDRPLDEEFVQAAADAGVHYCPTLTVRAGYMWLHRRELTDELRSQLPFVDATVRDRVLATEGIRRDRKQSQALLDAMDQRRARQRQLMAENLMRLHDRGVRVVMGTDAGNPLTLHGPSVFVELEAMQAAGLEPLEVLTAATRDAATAMGRGDDLGVLAPGRIADLVVLERDPAADIAHLRTITHVMRAGTLHDRAALLPDR